MGIIYKITCNKNDKIYVGITTNTLQIRWNKHQTAARKYKRLGDISSSKRGTCRYLYRAMNCHGFDVFEISIIEEVDDNMLNEREEYYIKLLNTLSPNGYNLTTGGELFKHCDETKQRISEKTSLGINVDTIDKFRKTEESKGLPKHIFYHTIKNAYAINRHPLCTFKSFKVSNYASSADAKKAAIDYMTELERTGVPYVSGMARMKNARKMLKEAPIIDLPINSDEIVLLNTYIEELIEEWIRLNDYTEAVT